MRKKLFTAVIITNVLILIGTAVLMYINQFGLEMFTFDMLIPASFADVQSLVLHSEQSVRFLIAVLAFQGILNIFLIWVFTRRKIK